MRLFLAALSFFIGFFAITGAFVMLLPATAPEWLTGFGILIGFSASLFLTNKLVNAPGMNFWSLARAAEPGDQPEQEGLLVSTEYRAARFFEVEGTDGDGPHYFIELQNGSVLYMSGRYLDAFGPRKAMKVIGRSRKFPCTEFVVRRDRYDRSVLDIQCRGSVLEPEVVMPPFEERDIQGGKMLEDGDIITSRTYEEMKASRAGERRR